MTGEVHPERRQEASEAGESVHLPGPSYLPVLVALGVTIIVVGIVISWLIVGLGAIITLVPLVRWIRSTREEIAELPLEH